MKKIRTGVLLAAALLMLAGCEKNASVPEVSETEALTSVTVTEEKTTPAVTEKPKKEIKPLTSSAKECYYENEDFSVTAKLSELQSSLYYPDIVNDMGANPKLFVVTAKIRVKNMTDEDRSFDCSKFALSDGSSEFYLYSSDFEDMNDIGSGKTEAAELRFLCTIEQAAHIAGFRFDGEDMDAGSKFIPEEFADIADKQSADDVREHLYRQWVIHASKGYYTVNSTPTTYEMHHIKGISDGENNYLAVTFTAYNRSDYAQLIEPRAFFFGISRYNDDELFEAEPLYISTDKNLIYSPQEVDLKLKGVGKLYEIPDFICMNPEGGTEFTMIYDAKDGTRARLFKFTGTHTDEPYYSFIPQAQSFDRDFGAGE